MKDAAIKLHWIFDTKLKFFGESETSFKCFQGATFIN